MAAVIGVEDLELLQLLEDRMDGHCQRKVRRVEFSVGERESGRSELTPLGECGDAVEREMVP